jgi:hypothetical protein
MSLLVSYIATYWGSPHVLLLSASLSPVTLCMRSALRLKVLLIECFSLWRMALLPLRIIVEGWVMRYLLISWLIIEIGICIDWAFPLLNLFNLLPQALYGSLTLLIDYLDSYCRLVLPIFRFDVGRFVRSLLTFIRYWRNDILKLDCLRVFLK